MSTASCSLDSFEAAPSAVLEALAATKITGPSLARFKAQAAQRAVAARACRVAFTARQAHRRTLKLLEERIEGARVAGSQLRLAAAALATMSTHFNSDAAIQTHVHCSAASTQCSAAHLLGLLVPLPFPAASVIVRACLASLPLRLPTLCALSSGAGGCRALGSFLRTVALDRASTIAVSADSRWMVTAHPYNDMVSVLALPGGQLVRTFGRHGAGPCEFKGIGKLCFTAGGTLLVVDIRNKRVQDITLEGVLVRVLSVAKFGGMPYCVAAHEGVIAVVCNGNAGPRVVVFDCLSGVVTSHFLPFGTAPPATLAGQLGEQCTQIVLTPDGCRVVLAERNARRLSVYTVRGVFVGRVGEGVLGGGEMDVLLSAEGEFVVADNRSHRVCVFSSDGATLVRSWGGQGFGNGQFSYPRALACAGQRLYVLEEFGGLQVFV